MSVALLLAVIAGGSLGIAFVIRPMTVSTGTWPGTLVYREGDNPWRSYAWLAASRKAPSGNSTSYAASTPRASEGTAPDVEGKSFSIQAQVTIPQDGADGMIITQGGLVGGWAFYLDNSRPVFHYNLDGIDRYTIAADRTLAPGPQTLLLAFNHDTKGAGEGGIATIVANGDQIARGRIEKTLATPFSFAEGLDIGGDTGTPVNLMYGLPFKFSGEIVNITVNFGRPSSLELGAPPH